MKRTVIISLIVMTLGMIIAAPAHCDDPVKKLGRGICNIGTFICEVPLQISRTNESDGPMAACTWGVLKGLGMSVLRLGTGAYETLTFPVPVPKDYAPIMRDPEFFFEEQNW